MNRPHGAASHGCHDSAEVLPRVVMGMARHGRQRRHSAPTVRRCHVYGPPRNKKRFELDMKMLRKRFPELVADLDKTEKEREEEAEESRIPEKEAEKLPALTVKSISFLMLGNSGSGAQQQTQGNAKRHHTDRYTCNQTKDGQPVLRRGQEFKVRIVFDRPYNKEQDDLTFVMEADENPGKGLLVNFKMDEERDKPFDPLPHWAARLVKENRAECAIRVSIYVPANCVVGEWDLKVKTILRGEDQSYLYLHPTPFIVLFNPWCKEDQVYYSEDQNDLKEYILNESGTVYLGCSDSMHSKPWIYGQFEKDIVQISLCLLRRAFGFKITSAMADPIIVSRALSRIINSSGDNGVLQGKWKGTYEGGRSPISWGSSTAILRQYAETKEPVKFGQCWVFSHVMTAVCRALGLPCRSVTNFDSAHDKDSSCTVDCYYDEEGNDLSSTDSIWNFHVWNEVWINRPEIKEHDCNGWQVIDATPQEQSDRSYQCGPSPVKAVKNGLVHVLYDTGFIFSEVNADIIHWVRDDDGEYTVSARIQNSVGARISTKPADGKPCGEPLFQYNMDDPRVRKDLTNDYKHKEGSAEERTAVERALRWAGKADKFYKESMDLDVKFDEDPHTQVGKDLTVSAWVTNLTQKTKEVDLLMSARTTGYRNDCCGSHDKQLCKEKLGKKKIPAGAKEKVQLTVPSSLYLGRCDEALNIYVYVRATDENNMPYTAQKPFQLTKPSWTLKGPAKAKPMETIELTATFTNPVPKTLTGCELLMEGPLLPAKKDGNKFQELYGYHASTVRDVKLNETLTFTFNLYYKEDKKEEDDQDDDGDDDDGAPEAEAEEEETKTQKIDFYCNELTSLCGSHTITCCKH